MEICRVCMNSSVTLMDIFSDRPLPDYEISLAEMLNELVDFKVNQDDKLPQKICVTCGLNAQIAFRFQRRFQQSNQLLCMRSMEIEKNYVCVLSEDSSDESVHKQQRKSLSPIINELNNLQTGANSQTQRKAIPKTRHVSSSSSFSSTSSSGSSSSSISNGSSKTELTRSAENAETHRYQLRAVRRKSYYQERVCYQQPTTDTLQTPKRLRSIVRNFKCDQCNSTFATQENLDKHKINHKFIVYNCLQCKASFDKKTQLEMHARTHIAECPNICLQCSKSFRNSYNLHTHQTTHSPLRPFQCNVCKLSFKTLKTLRKHERTHTGAPPEHKCKICERAYVTKHSLKKHLRLHLNT